MSFIGDSIKYGINESNSLEPINLNQSNLIPANTMICRRCGSPMKQFADGKAVCFNCGRTCRYNPIKANINIRNNVYVHPPKEKTVEVHHCHESGFWSFLKSDNGAAIISIFVLFSIAASFGIYFLFRNAHIKSEIALGKITAGESQRYEDQDYKAVVKQLQEIGFTNISTVDLDDSGILIWNNGDVESVSINGETYFTSSDYFFPDSHIIITYH